MVAAPTRATSPAKKIIEELLRGREHRSLALSTGSVTTNGECRTHAIKYSHLSQEEAMAFGAIAGALVGLGADGEEGAEAGAVAGAIAAEDGAIFDETEAWYLADAIPPGDSAAIALIEHRWAIPLRESIQRAGASPSPMSGSTPRTWLLLEQPRRGSRAGAHRHRLSSRCPSSPACVPRDGRRPSPRGGRSPVRCRSESRVTCSRLSVSLTRARMIFMSWAFGGNV